MPILKTEILGSKIEINYENNDKEKLLRLIENFKNRLSEFPNNGRISNQAIILLSALKAEDQIEENKILITKYKENKDKISEQINIIENLKKEIFLIKDELNKSNNMKISSDKHYKFSLEQISILKDDIELIKKRIIDSINNE